ncbi:hypothetical protein CE91St43_27820 [Oscillospiraceae bacterium]|nr:hypothetical protein CE91St43_27820 [Oscillospiraceae bacterium]
MKKNNPRALLPILMFLLLYLGLGLSFEYALNIPMGFYNIPIVICFLIAILVACLQNPELPFDKKLEIMGQGVGDKNIVTMLLIFLVAGTFVGVVGRSSAESVAYFMLSIIPARFAVAVLFVVACFVSTAMGTSVGTITLITPIAVSVASASGFGVPLCIGAVMGGAMFGDNLSFISDTTIAACNGQGCAMKDKFRENFSIALPAALATLAVILVLSFQVPLAGAVVQPYDLIQIIPYVLVLIGGIIGFNVFVVLLAGILSGSVIMLATGHTAATDLLASMGSGAAGMFETAMVAVLVAAMCALIRVYGGFDALLNFIRRVFKGRKGGQLGMGLLVGVMDVATANNTVAIVMANPIAKEMSQEYGITPRKTASLLDTFSCVFQGVIPYGAQMLVAISAAAELGHAVSAFDITPFLPHLPLSPAGQLPGIHFRPAGAEESLICEKSAAGAAPRPHPLGAALSGAGVFLTPRTLMPPPNVVSVGWHVVVGPTGHSRDPEALARVEAAMEQTTLLPAGLPIPKGFYGHAIEYPTGTDLYMVYLFQKDVPAKDHMLFYMDEAGHIFKNHVVYNYACGGEELLDLLRDERVMEITAG